MNTGFCMGRVSQPYEPARVVAPEILDELPPSAPEARRSRRDLQRVNFWMGNGPLLATMLGSVAGKNSPTTVVDLGGGDGRVMLGVARRTGWAGVRLHIVDRQKLLTAETAASFERLGWSAASVQADVLEWLSGRPRTDILVANLFLHHFRDRELGKVLAAAAHCCWAFVACDPRRFKYAAAAGQLVRLLGCSSVTRHDAVTSIRAGFRGLELSCLWPDRASWALEEGEAGLFSHVFTARRLQGTGSGHQSEFGSDR
jgi:hypothetical protein